MKTLHQIVEGRPFANGLQKLTLPRRSITRRQRARAELPCKINRLKQWCSLILQQGVAALAGPAAGISWNRPNRTGPLHGESCRDQCTTAFRTLHNNESSRELRHQAIPGCKVAAPYRAARAMFAEQQPRHPNALLQRAMVRGVNPVERGSKNANRRSLLSQTPVVDSGINTLRQTTNHGPACTRQGTAKILRHSEPMVRCRTGTNDGNGLTQPQPVQQRTTPAAMQTRRRPIQKVQAIRPERITWEQNIGRHREIGPLALLGPVALNGIQKAFGPSQRIAKLIPRPTPELIRPNAALFSQGTQR